MPPVNKTHFEPRQAMDTANTSTESAAAQQVTQGSSPAQLVTRITPSDKMTLAEVRAKLDGKTGKRFWKNLDELADTPAFQELMQEEFPRQASGGEWVNSVSRRGFMKVMGASFALAGLAGCTKQPDEPIYPYIKQPEDLILGTPMFFATAHPFPTGAIPVLVKSDAFHPVKIEGNPEHPAGKGKADAFTQASLLDLYDPDRSQHVRFRGQNAEWPYFQQQFSGAVSALPGGQGLYFLSEATTSPSFAAQWKQIQAKYPQAKLITYEPIGSDTTGTQYKLEDADVILSLDADFLGGIHFPGFLPMSSQYAERHRFEPGKPMNRMYVVETMPSVTGYKAEHALRLKPSEVDAFATALASGGTATFSNPDAQKFLQAVQADLKKTGGRCAVIAGPQSSPVCVAAAAQLNASLGANGKTVFSTASLQAVPAEPGNDIRSLVSDMNAGKVKWLVMLGTNPLYSAPADLNFAEAFNNVPNTVHLGSHVDETGFFSTWHIPKSHYLESWTDCRASDGTISIVQPMIAPLYNSVTAHDVFQALLDPSQSAYDVVAANAKSYIKADFAAGWRKALHDGWVEGTALPASAANTAPAKPTVALAPSSGDQLEIRFLADPSLYDGRYGNNGWLQELPKQVTNLSWDNAALVSLNTMTRLGIEENEAVELTVDGRKMIVPVLMVPGHPDGAVTVHLGLGRRAEAGRVGAGVGFNAYSIRTAEFPYAVGGATLAKGHGTYDLCVTKVHNIEHRGAFAQHDLEHPEFDKQGTYSLAGHEALERSIIRYATVDEATKNPKFAEEGASETLVNKVGYNPQGETPKSDESLFAGAWRYDHQDQSSKQVQNAWAMSVDMNSCIGCNACVVACYAENNIPVVGREQVKVGRNMQWIRIDSYYEGDLHAPKAHFQPMMCQHCESAGCEQVCPVGATVHTPEGINTMVYNRCVGTRYCSNNCVYKVRRFNFLLYADYDTESLKFMRNPDVTVRSRGVMEKCSYCVQRIEEAKFTADKENRAIRDGEVVTACQQTCPTDAIIFGNKNDPNSRVAKRRADERDYQVLADLNYHPRTTYTAGVINPNPELA
ncbi:MAG TPA: TAT-variant-translocated molybdopterin oxidoreductase [Acidobacteriaceae bacterium]|nr:TAT-variant-translocated molybdopterin oxidoreductase [Acidobacteriaceae bacterium]